MQNATSEIEKAYRSVLHAWASLTPEMKGAKLDDFAVGYAFASGKIENDEITLHDTREVFEGGRVISYTGDIRTLFEIQNLKISWDWVLDLALDGFDAAFKFDEALTLEAHRLLTQGTYDERRWTAGERPGSYKRGEYVVGARGIGSPATDVSRDMEELFTEVNSYLAHTDKILTVAGYLHARFVDIHPFADGNGRSARLLMNLLLLGMGHPPITIREEDRMAYYGALDAFHNEGELQPFLEFLQVEAVQTWESLLIA